MFYQPLVLFHICSAVVGLLSGFLSMAFRKGSGLHRASGNVFFVSMLGMSGAGATIAAFLKPNTGNVMGGLLTFYLVATGWMAGRRRARSTGLFDRGAFLMVLALGTAEVISGFQAASSPTGLKEGYPPTLYFVFGAIALLFAVSDVRMILRGGIEGAPRIARHLWRMCLALLMATISFYPSRAHLFSRAVNDSHLLYVPHVLLAGSTLYWLVRVSRKRQRHDKVIEETRGDAIAA